MAENEQNNPQSNDQQQGSQTPPADQPTSTDPQSGSGQTTPSDPLEDKRAERDANRTQVTANAADVNTLIPEAGQDVGESQVQEIVDAEQEAGFRGIKMDPTPNENYAATNSAPQNDLPTPETDQDLRREAAASRQLDGPAPY